MSNQKGFGAIEGLLILIAVSILGFTGWFVWQSQQQTNSAYDNSVKTSKRAKVKQKANSSQYSSKESVYCSKSEKICFKYPSIWNVKESNRYVNSDAKQGLLKQAVKIFNESSKELAEFSLTYGQYGMACDPADNENQEIVSRMPASFTMSADNFQISSGESSKVYAVRVHSMVKAQNYAEIFLTNSKQYIDSDNFQSCMGTGIDDMIDARNAKRTMENGQDRFATFTFHSKIKVASAEEAKTILNNATSVAIEKMMSSTWYAE